MCFLQKTVIFTEKLYVYVRNIINELTIQLVVKSGLAVQPRLSFFPYLKIMKFRLRNYWIKITDITEIKLTAIALAMETAIDHFNSSSVDAVKILPFSQIVKLHCPS